MWRQNDDAAAAIGESGPESGQVTGEADLERFARLDRLEAELAELERADDLATRRRDLRALIAEHRL